MQYQFKSGLKGLFDTLSLRVYTFLRQILILIFGSLTYLKYVIHSLSIIMFSILHVHN